MYPIISLWLLPIHTFGIFLFIGFLLFYYMLIKLSKKLELNTNFFISNTLFFLIFSFVFSRIFYILSNWDDYSFLLDSFDILSIIFPNEYSLSFIGTCLGLFFSLWILLNKYNLAHEKYVDAIVLSFFFAAPVGYIGAFLGGQIFGVPTDSIFAIAITHPESPVPFTSPIYPLALFYACASFILFCIGYIARNIFLHHGFFGYGGIMIFSILIFFGEFINGGQDFIQDIIGLNVTQLGACFFFGISFVFFSQFSKKNLIEETLPSSASSS